MQNKAFSKILILIIVVILLGGGTVAWQYFGGPKEVKDETADWKTYRNEEYGFEVKYPKDWTFHAIKYSEPEGGSPFIRFYPKSKVWIDRMDAVNGITPVVISIFEGSSQEYSSEIPQKDEKEVLINNRSAIEIISVAEGETYHYVINNPSGEGCIVVLNQVPELIARLKVLFKVTEIPEEEEFRSIFNQMLSTFRFLE